MFMYWSALFRFVGDILRHEIKFMRLLRGQKAFRICRL